MTAPDDKAFADAAYMESKLKEAAELADTMIAISALSGASAGTGLMAAQIYIEHSAEKVARVSGMPRAQVDKGIRESAEFIAKLYADVRAASAEAMPAVAPN